MKWLADEGITSETSLGEDFIQAEVPIAVAKRLFNTEAFYAYKNERTDALIHRAVNYSLPEDILPHVDFLSGIHDLPGSIHLNPVLSSKIVLDLEHLRKVGAADAPADPPTIFSTYKITQATKINANSSMGLVEALGQDYSEDDLKSFLSKYKLPAQSVSKVIGPNVSKTPLTHMSVVLPNYY
jgi:hypothetical protein